MLKYYFIALIKMLKITKSILFNIVSLQLVENYNTNKS